MAGTDGIRAGTRDGNRDGIRDGIRIETRGGPVLGRMVDGTRRFEGIPYALAPVGDRRFEAPAGARPWTTALRCDTPTPAPPQRRGALLGTRPVSATSEDCLHVNVITPTDAADLPVMVWIHGGGFTNGFAADPLHAGTRLVRRGRVVLVTFDYRLGILGQFHDPEHGAANLALRDQLLALRWVADNIAAFGGDAERVTLFGESAGAMSIRALMATPQADGLYARIVLQSGTDGFLQTPADAAAVRTAALAGRSRDGLRQLDVQGLLELQEGIDRDRRAQTGRGAWRPVRDGTLVVRDDDEALVAAAARGVRCLLGSNADEQRLFVNLRRAPDAERRRQATVRALRMLGVGAQRIDEATDEAMRAYEIDREDGAPAERLAALLTDAWYRLPVLRMARTFEDAGAPAFVYRFDWPSPALRGRLGACHALEIPFVFGTLDAPGMARFAGVDADARVLSDAMIDAWSCFAHGTGGAPKVLPDGTAPVADPPDADDRGWRPWHDAARCCWIADRDPRCAFDVDDALMARWAELLEAA